MNPKIRALLWEELRVSGAVAFCCTLVGFTMQLILRADPLISGWSANPWRLVSELVLTATLGVPLLMGLLFTLSPANSGHLSGGFSRRILRLPVDTWSAVLVVLLTRLVEILIASGILVATCWALFGHGPGTRAVFLIAGVYLVIQLLDWLRAVAPALVLAVVIAIVLVLFAPAHGVSAWRGDRQIGAWSDVLTSQDSVTPTVLAAFALSAAAAYAFSLVVVRWTRSGERIGVLTPPDLDTLLALPTGERRKPFASPKSAQTWFELRRGGLYFPAMVTVFWLLLIVGLLVAMYSSRDVGRSKSDLLAPLWVFELGPFLALLSASFAWSVWFAAQRSGTKRLGRPAVFAVRQPITKAQVAQARLAAIGVNLAPMLIVIALVSTVSFLFTDERLILRIMREALAHNETSLREVAQILVGPALVVGLVAWAIMSAGAVNACLFLLIGGAAVAQFAIEVDPALTGASWIRQCGLCASWILFVAPTLWLGERLITSVRKGIVSRRAGTVCVLIWGGLTLAILPFSSADAGHWAGLLLVSLALAAFTVLSYVMTTVSLTRREPREPLQAENPEQHARASFSKKHRIVTLGAVVLVIVAVAWLRWPIEPAWRSAWRAEGLPITLNELNDWYKPVPEQQNLAVRYLQAIDKMNGFEAQWNAYVLGRSSAPGSPGANLQDVRNQDINAERTDGNLLVVGHAEVERTDQIPPEVWKTTKKYWDTVSSKVCPELNVIAHAGLTQSRYPIDLRQGMAVLLPHLGKLRGLARQLGVENWVACVERRPDDVINAILDTFPIAESLKDEPILISQLVRFAILGMGQSYLENAMNRLSLPESDLKRIQDAITHILPSDNGPPLLERSLIGEQVMVLDTASSFGLNLPTPPANNGTESSIIESPWERAAEAGGDLLGYGKFQRMVSIRAFAMLQHSGRETLRAGRIVGGMPKEGFWTSHLYARAIIAAILMPALERAYYSEWRIRTQLDLAGTAVAVERFRIGQGRLPKQLDELVPAFLERVPGDLYNEGRPLSYLVGDNGEFVVYSFGENRKDDHGVERQPGQGWSEGDVIFSVVPPANRDRPQVAPEFGAGTTGSS